METLTLFLDLFGTFFLIGAFTIGGGYAMLSLIQGEVVTTHQWISESTFTDIVAISQMTPGPIGINSATYVGYDVLSQATGSHLMGILGSATATLALVIPSFILVLLIVRFYTKFKSSVLFEGVMGWLRPTVVGLIGAAAVILIVKTTWFQGAPSSAIVAENFPDWKSWCLLAAKAAASRHQLIQSGKFSATMAKDGAPWNQVVLTMRMTAAAPISSSTSLITSESPPSRSFTTLKNSVWFTRISAPPVRVKNRDGRHLKFTAKFRSRWSTRRSWRAYLDRFPPSS